jgi:hypothetical protein
MVKLASAWGMVIQIEEVIYLESLVNLALLNQA